MTEEQETVPQETKRRRRWARLVFIVLVAMIAILGTAYGGWWLYLASTVESGVRQWASANRAHGARVEYELDVSGFPGRVEAVARDFDFQRADGWSWHGPQLVIRTKPWELQTIRLEFEGRHRLSLPGQDGLPLVVAFDGGKGRVGLAPAQGGMTLTSGRLTLSTVALAQTSRAEALQGILATAVFGDADTLGIRMLTADLFHSAEPVENTEQDGVRLEVAASDVLLPAAIETPLGNVITEVLLGARLMGMPTAFTPDELARWTANGGELRLDRFDIAWGPLGLNAAGFVSLDPDMQYVGKIDAEIRGLPETVDALVDAGLIRPQQANLIKALGRGLAAGNPEADAPVRLPLIIGNGFLQFGPFKLVTLPPSPFG